MSVTVLDRAARKVLAGLLGALITAVSLLMLPACAGAAGSGSLVLRAGAAPDGAPGVELSAHVVGATGGPTPVTVKFYVHVGEFAGAPLLLIGTAALDPSGDGSMVYQPTWPGTQRFVATSVDADGAVLASTARDVSAAQTDPFAGAVQSVRPDGIIGRWAVVALLALVIAMWLVLIGTVVRVQRGPVQPRA